MAFKRLGPRMHGLVRANMTFLRKPFAANIAFEWPISRVNNFVPVQVATLIEDFPARIALVLRWILSTPWATLGAGPQTGSTGGFFLHF